MDGFANLLTDAFSESSVPLFSDGDLDFENLGFEEKGEEDETENSTTKTDEALLQEVTDESEALLGKATTDAPLTAEDEESTGDESDDKEFTRKESEDSSTSSEEERSSSGEEEEPGDLLMSVCYSNNPYRAQIQGGIFAVEQPMASEGADSPKDRNEMQGEAESDEEASCLRRIPECEDETVMMKEAEGATGEASPNSDHEDMTAEQEANILPQETENPYKISPMVEDNLEFPCLSLQNLQDLMAEVDGEEQVKMTDFTGDEHQEAGETIADYPSDFSSGEFTRAELNASPLPKQEHGAATGTLWIGSTEDSGYEKDDGFLYSTDLEMNADQITSLDGATGEVCESNSYSSSDDKEPLRGIRDELTSVPSVENNMNPEDVQLHELSWWSSSDDTIKARSDPADFISTNTFLLTTEVLDDTEDSSPNDNQCPTEDVNSVVHRETTRPSNLGSIDDSFFFNTDSSEVTEQPVDDEDEEKRNTKQMQKRIEAFKRFYDNNDENGREERQIKVQFCADPLSQVKYYDTDNSDRDSLSSSTDTEEDLSSEELREPEDLLRELKDITEAEDLLREDKDTMESEDLLREHKNMKGAEDLLSEPEDLLSEPKDMTKPKDLLSEHKDMTEPENLLREPKGMMEHKDLMREIEDLLKEPEDLLREPEDPLREHKDTMELKVLLREPEDPLWEHKDVTEPKELLRGIEDLLREPENLLKEPEDLLSEPKNMMELEDMLREPQDLLREPEDLLSEPKNMTKLEDMLREPEDLLSEPKNMTELEDMLREPEDLLREHKDTLKEFEDTLELTTMCDLPNPEQPLSVSEVRDTQTSTNVYKGVSKLKLMLNLGVVMMMGFLMFWLITDQPDWLRDLFSV